MAKDAEEVVIGANGSVYVASVGSTIPAHIGTALGGDWTELGFATEDGVKWTDGKTVGAVKAWQSFYPIRRMVTEREGKLAFTLLQWNSDTVQLAFGGGEVTEPAAGKFRYTPPDPSEIDERMVAVEWQDSNEHFRLVFKRCMVSESVEVDIMRTQEARLPITVELLGSDDEAPYIFDTDSDAFAAAS